VIHSFHDDDESYFVVLEWLGGLGSSVAITVILASLGWIANHLKPILEFALAAFGLGVALQLVAFLIEL